MKYDVCLSVWNRFFSAEQCAGFARNGLKTHWVGNTRPPGNVAKTSFQALSWLLMRAHFMTGSEILKHASMEVFDFSAGMLKTNSKLIWAYVERNNRMIHVANQQRTPVVLDAPIGHQRGYMEILLREYQAAGMSFPRRLVSHWTRKCEDAYSRADYIMAGSSFVKQTLVERGVNPTKVIVNPYGIDGARWKSSFQMRQNRPHRKEIIFIYTAGVGLRKGVHYLIRAWKIAALPHSTLLIVGSGSLNWEKLCGGLPSNVKLLGFQNHPQLKELYASADVFVLPSLYEGLVRSGLEAMAAGLPAIITPNTGLTDFVQHGKQGWIVPVADVEALANQLRYCHEHREEVVRVGRAAHELLIQQTFEAYGDRCARYVKDITDQWDYQANKISTN